MTDTVAIPSNELTLKANALRSRISALVPDAIEVAEGIARFYDEHMIDPSDAHLELVSERLHLADLVAVVENLSHLLDCAPMSGRTTSAVDMVAEAAEYVRKDLAGA